MNIEQQFLDGNFIRDSKPDNVLIGGDERPRVVDFGLARVSTALGEDALMGAGLDGTVVPETEAQSLGCMTRPGVISGTPGYMSPEQYRGGDIDSRSDQWSFCAALYEALYGYLPFSGSSLHEHEKSVHGLPCPPPPDTKVPDEIRQALFRGLSTEPGQRFPSMAELIASLTQELRGDMAAGRQSRLRFNLAWVIAMLLTITVVQMRYAQSSVVPHPPGLFWPGLIMVVLLGGLSQRQTLLRNRFHRHFWILLLVTLVLFFLQRLVGFVLDLPVSRTFPFQMVALAGTMTIVATTLIRWLSFLPLIPLLAVLLSVTTAVPQQMLLLAYPLTGLCLAIGWHRAAQSTQHGIGTSTLESNSKSQPRRTHLRPTYRRRRASLRRSHSKSRYSSTGDIV